MTTGRTPLWTAITEALRHDLQSGKYGPGDRLPNGSELASRFGVNRHTARRALAALEDEGLVIARRGAGVFVQGTPVSYPMGRRVRFHQNLLAAGRNPERQTLLLETRTANEREAKGLRLETGARVHVFEGLSLSDGIPLALFRSTFSADRLPNMRDFLEDDPSVTSAYALHGIHDYVRSSTEITAKTATATMAARLTVQAGAPLLRTIGIDTTPEGTPLEYGRTWFVADRVALILEGDEEPPT